MKTLICLLMLCIPAFSKDHLYKPAKITNISFSESFLDGDSRKNAIYTLQIDDLVLTLRGGLVRPHGSDESSIFIVGDPLQASVEGDSVFVLKPDGKVMKATIVKRERLPAP